MTLGIPIFCFACFLAFSSIAIFAPRRAPAVPLVRFEPGASQREREPARIATVRWPAQIDARASDADAEVRLALARELGGCRGRWARETLTHALAEEPDPRVASALAEALKSMRDEAAQA